MKTIAVIDDDVHIGNMLEEALHRKGYGVLRAYSGSEALYLMEKQRPDLVLLDLMLPGIAGEDVLSKLSGIPVIVVSAKTATEHKVDLLLSGAVDYVTKPFELKELMARIAVHLRGTDGGKEQPGGLQSTLSVGPLSLDFVSREVLIGEKKIRITRTEYAILKLLMENPGKAISKSAILDDISTQTPDCTETSLKIHVSNLRKKLRAAGGGNYIESVWGIGFRLVENPENPET